MKDVILYDQHNHQIRTTVRTASEQERAFRFLEMQARAAFKAAEQDRTNANWVVTSQGINTILTSELARMRNRSRWLESNNPHVGGAINSFLNYVIGTGFDLQMAVVHMVQNPETGKAEKEEMDSFNDYVEDVFGLWGDDVILNASDTAPESWFDTQDLLLRRWIIDGEVFIRMIVDKSFDVVPFRLQIISADQLDTNTTKNPDTGNGVFLGVEYDKLTWKPVAYWVYSTVHTDPKMQTKTHSVRVPAEDMIHVFSKRFPLQMRGIPFFAGVTDKLFQLGEYSNAQLIRSKIAALFGVLISGTEGGGFFKDDDSSGDQNSNGFPVDADGNILANLAPGIIGQVPEGTKVDTVSPSAPETAYEMFVNDQLNAIGTGIEYGLSYTSLTRDTRRTTFAGGRQAENMDIQGYRRLSKKFAGKALSPTFRKWMDVAVASAAVIAPGYFIEPKRWQRHSWLPSGWARGINPLQEIRAQDQSMKSFVTTLADEASFGGKEWQQNLRLAGKIMREKERLGLNTEIEAGKEEAGNDAKGFSAQDDDASRAFENEVGACLEGELN
jgi:lambda family phage portal protein